MAHALRPELPVLGMSGLANQKPRTTDFATELLAKPFTATKLLSEVHRALHPGSDTSLN
jgi:hypothetical protein